MTCDSKINIFVFAHIICITLYMQYISIVCPIFSGVSCCSLNMVFFGGGVLFVSLFVCFDFALFFFLRPLHFLSFDLLHPTLFIYSTQTFLKKCIQWGYTSDPVPYKHSNDMYIHIRISTLKMNKQLITIEISIQSKL